MSINYAQEKFYTAVLSMEKSPSSLRTRIYNAFLSFHPIRPEEDLPEDLRADYKWIIEHLEKYEPKGDKGSVQMSLEKLDDETIKKIAEKIVDIYDQLSAYQ